MEEMDGWMEWHIEDMLDKHVRVGGASVLYDSVSFICCSCCCVCDHLCES